MSCQIRKRGRKFEHPFDIQTVKLAEDSMVAENVPPKKKVIYSPPRAYDVRLNHSR